MLKSPSPGPIVVGFALFSMFFGAGNLIFPILLGARFQGSFYWCAFGFIISAVFLPILGILAITGAQGDISKLFAGIWREKYTKLFFLLVLIFWIPLGSGPRCVVLAYSSFLTNFNFSISLWLFSLLFLFLVWLVIQKRGNIINILGKFLTPVLLISVGLIIIFSFTQGDLDASSLARSEIFLTGITQGYYTQDLIAALFFATSIISILSYDNNISKKTLRITFHGGLISIILLAITYTALMAASAFQGEYLQNLAGDQVVAKLAYIALGPNLGALSSVTVALACFTTEVALVIVFADFIRINFLNNTQGKKSIIFTLLVIYFISLLEFSGVMSIMAPAMQIIYPILLILVVRLLIKKIIYRTQ